MNHFEVKTFEIRDEGTRIPALAIHGIPSSIPEPDHYLIRLGGWGEDQEFTYLMNLNDCRAQFDPFKWEGSRTMHHAHKYIREHWNELETGSVVDVEFILGETDKPKESERIECRNILIGCGVLSPEDI